MKLFSWFKKKRKCSYKEFESMLEENLDTFQHKLRVGQIIMHTLYKAWPEMYNKITGTEHDCFYLDNKSSDTLNKLKAEWNV